MSDQPDRPAVVLGRAAYPAPLREIYDLFEANKYGQRQYLYLFVDANTVLQHWVFDDLWEDTDVTSHLNIEQAKNPESPRLRFLMRIDLFGELNEQLKTKLGDISSLSTMEKLCMAARVPPDTKTLLEESLKTSVPDLEGHKPRPAFITSEKALGAFYHRVDRARISLVHNGGRSSTYPAPARSFVQGLALAFNEEREVHWPRAGNPHVPEHLRAMARAFEDARLTEHRIFVVYFDQRSSGLSWDSFDTPEQAYIRTTNKTYSSELKLIITMDTQKPFEEQLCGQHGPYISPGHAVTQPVIAPGTLARPRHFEYR